MAPWSRPDQRMVHGAEQLAPSGEVLLYDRAAASLDFT
jgi:hypothetical protein